MSFLPGWYPVGARKPALISFVTTASDSTAQTTYTFTGVSFGAADTTRRIIVAFHWTVQNAARTFASATIGGIAAGVAIETTTGPTSAQTDTGIMIISALVPTGTSGTIAVTLSGAASRAFIGVFNQINESSPTPTTMADNTVSANVLTGTLNIANNGTLVAAATSTGAAGISDAWTGATEDYDQAHAGAAGVNLSGGHDTGLPIQTPRTVTDTLTGTISRGAAVAASWS